MKSRTAQNKISCLTSDTGRLLHTDKEIETNICTFYETLLGTKAVALPAIEPGVMKMGNILDRKDQLMLLQTVSTEEVRQALNDIDDGKAPGHDGFNAVLFKKAWSIIGKDITSAVVQFFDNPNMPSEVNCSSVTLIPKRMNGVMEKLVENNQTAFVPGRLISDNIILSHELVKGYNRKFFSPRCMLKIDMQKAYDSVEWPFLEQILISMNFPDQFVTWVRMMLKPLGTDLNFNHHPKCDKLNIVQLGFADDLLMFCRGDEISIYKVFDCFQRFSKASGLIANTGKSSIYFGGVDERTQQVVLERLKFSKGTLPFRYLGVPLSTKRISVMQCTPLLDKMIGKVTQWTAKLLSYASRLQLASWMLKKIFKAIKTLDEAGIDEEHFRASQVFSIKQVYLKLRGDFQKVSWRRIICNNFGTPKWTFILYLALNKKLYTRDRLNKWNITDQIMCPLCESANESVEHVFFKCNYSTSVWKKLLGWLGYNRDAMEWTNEMTWLTAQVNGRAAQSHMVRMVVAASVYYVWQERNNRVFTSKQRTPEVLIKRIVQEVMIRGSMQSKLVIRLSQLDHYPVDFNTPLFSTDRIGGQEVSDHETRDSERL
ncbi:uncharacterized protein LOC132609918 [Lycium barbarum]|uniref:uncharacterized protein LOC132609918 n=1 Tax=Lycium barbarum TaxID=112863 RepID=UPI00293EEF7B|nr:uncharacterized protein LOC132609918 [Lycium barbarum]